MYDFYVITHTFIYKEDNVYRENEKKKKKRENVSIWQMFGKTFILICHSFPPEKCIRINIISFITFKILFLKL